MLASEEDNLPIWAGQKGWQEIYSLKVSDPAHGVALWLRYALCAPWEGEAYAEVWGMAFDAAKMKHLVVREACAFDQVRLESDPFSFQIGRAVLTNKAARGRIEGDGQRLGWVLRWEPCESSYRHFSNKLLYHAAPLTPKMNAPQPDLRVSGEVLFNRQRIEVFNAPGIQQHVWGTKHAQSWGWAFCNSFEDDPDALFEALAFRPQKMGLLEPQLTSFRFRIGGEEILASGLLSMLKGDRGRFDTGGWFFEVDSGSYRVEGTIEVPYGGMLGVVYYDPDGEPIYAHTTQVADVVLKIFSKQRGKWIQEQELNAHGCCALEVLTRDPDDEIPYRIEAPAEV